MSRKKNDENNSFRGGMGAVFRESIENSQGDPEDEIEVSVAALQGGKAVADLLENGGKKIGSITSLFLTVISIIALFIALEIAALMYAPKLGYEILYKVNDIYQAIPRKF